MSTQYSLTSYKIRARSYNAAGWSDYSDISSTGTAVWINNTGTDTETDTVCGPDGCSETDTDTVCGPDGCTDTQSQNCECGTQSRSRTRTSSRTRTRTRTSSRTRTRSYQYYSRSGSTSSTTTYGTWSDWSAYSYSSWSAYSAYSGYTYSAWGEYGGWSTCSGGTWSAPASLPASFVADGPDGSSTTYTRFAETNSNGNATGSYYYYVSAYHDSNPPFGSSGPICGCYEHHSYAVEYCTYSQTYRAVDENRCRYYRSTSSCGGGGGS